MLSFCQRHDWASRLFRVPVYSVYLFFLLRSHCLTSMFRSRGGNACCNLVLSCCNLAYLVLMYLFYAYFPFVVCCFSMSNLFSTRRIGILRKNRGRWSGGQVRPRQHNQQEANDANRIQHSVTSGADPGAQSRRDSDPGFSYSDMRASVGDDQP